MSERVRPTVLDTDIGSDVDDLLALTLLARAPQVRLVGVTTVYGDTLLRRLTHHA
jgi:purine nucleosidase